jgi:hypothetical protein
MDLSKASTEALIEELERRKEEEIPQVLENIDWSEVINNALQRRNAIIAGTYHQDNDDENYMFEEVMTAVFGERYFQWEIDNTE